MAGKTNKEKLDDLLNDILSDLESLKKQETKRDFNVGKLSDISIIQDNMKIMYITSDEVFDEGIYDITSLEGRGDIIDISNFVGDNGIKDMTYRNNNSWDIFGRYANSARSIFEKCRDKILI